MYILTNAIQKYFQKKNYVVNFLKLINYIFQYKFFIFYFFNNYL